MATTPDDLYSLNGLPQVDPYASPFTGGSTSGDSMAQSIDWSDPSGNSTRDSTLEDQIIMSGGLDSWSAGQSGPSDEELQAQILSTFGDEIGNNPSLLSSALEAIKGGAGAVSAFVSRNPGLSAGMGSLMAGLYDRKNANLDTTTTRDATGLTDQASSGFTQTENASNTTALGQTSSATDQQTSGATSSVGQTTTDQKTGVEDWAKQAGKDLLSYARELKPYERIDKGEGTVGGMLQSGALGTYTNPYLESVLNPMRQINLEQRAQDSNQRAANAVMRGAFGGSRAMIEDQYKDYLAGRAWNENESKIRSDAYNTALGQMSGDVNRNVADWTKFQEGGKDLLSAYTPALSGIANVADRTTSGVTGTQNQTQNLSSTQGLTNTNTMNQTAQSALGTTQSDKTAVSGQTDAVTGVAKGNPATVGAIVTNALGTGMGTSLALNNNQQR